MVEHSFVRRFCLDFLLLPIFPLLLLIFLPLLSVAFIVRSIEASIYKKMNGGRPTSTLTNMWVIMNKDASIHTDINGCMVVAGDLSLDKLIEKVKSVFNLKQETGEKIYWQTSRYVQPGYINNYWVEESSFSYDDHVVQHAGNTATSPKELKEIILQGSTRDYPTKSPWFIKVIPYVEHGMLKTAVHFRIWHGMSDGSSLAYLLMLRLADSETSLDADQISMPKYLQIKKFILYLKSIWSIPRVLLENLVMQKEASAFDNVKSSGKKQISWTKNLDVTKIKELKAKLGVTFNDVVLAFISLSLSNVLNKAGEYCPKQLSAIIPLNTRFHVEDASVFKNKYAALIVKLPTREKDLISSCMTMNHQMYEIKRSCKTITSEIIINSLPYCLIPDSLLEAVMNKGCDNMSVSISNIVGPPIRLRLCGHVIEDLVHWAPCPPPLPLSVSVVTYGGALRVGVECDQALFVDATSITDSFEEMFETLLDP